MRPRVFPAEDAASYQPSMEHRVCFNEAAGIPRGRLTQHRLEGKLPVELQ